MSFPVYSISELWFKCRLILNSTFPIYIEKRPTSKQVVHFNLWNMIFTILLLTGWQCSLEALYFDCVLNGFFDFLGEDIRSHMHHISSLTRFSKLCLPPAQPILVSIPIGLSYTYFCSTYNTMKRFCVICLPLSSEISSMSIRPCYPGRPLGAQLCRENVERDAVLNQNCGPSILRNGVGSRGQTPTDS